MRSVGVADTPRGYQGLFVEATNLSRLESYDDPGVWLRDRRSYKMRPAGHVGTPVGRRLSSEGLAVARIGEGEL